MYANPVQPELTCLPAVNTSYGAMCAALIQVNAGFASNEPPAVKMKKRQAFRGSQGAGAVLAFGPSQSATPTPANISSGWEWAGRSRPDPR